MMYGRPDVKEGITKAFPGVKSYMASDKGDLVFDKVMEAMRKAK